MSNIPNELLYTSEHEWIKIEQDVATVGITDFAQSSLGDVVYVELPNPGKKLEKDKTFGVVESIKSVSDLYVPLTGEVVEKNSAVESSPELINENSYGHWLIKIKLTRPEEVSQLLKPEQYSAQIAK